MRPWQVNAAKKRRTCERENEEFRRLNAMYAQMEAARERGRQDFERMRELRQNTPTPRWWRFGR
jgi:hypothetical protein